MSGLDGVRLESVTTPHDLAGGRVGTTCCSPRSRPAAVSPTARAAQTDRQPRSAAAQLSGLHRRVKTGYTNLAKETHVGMAQRDGHRIVVVQMYGDDDL